jgi:hypothetical protein
MHQTQFTTIERGVWPPGIAKSILDAVDAHPRITVSKNTQIQRVENNNGWYVIFNESSDGPYKCILNTAWAGRMHIDAASGFPPENIWFTRFKFGLLLQNAAHHFRSYIPRNQTGLVGAYGDSVLYPQNGSLYMNWYPVGLRRAGKHSEIDYSWPKVENMEDFFCQTVEGMATIDPTFHEIDIKKAIKDVTLLGDFIIAQGSSDIVDAQSGLHKRFKLGAKRLAPGLISVETGKYTSAPRCAIDCVNMALEDL